MIPIRNIYYLVLYAFDCVKNINDIGDKDFENIKDFDDVIADIFIKQINALIKKGLYKNYNSQKEELNLIKGKIKINESMTLRNGKKVCEYDEFNSNNEYNKIIKFIINRLILTENITNNLKIKLKTAYFSFNDIQLHEYNDNDFKKIKFNKLNSNYEFPIKLASFIMNNTIPSEKEGCYKFINIFKNEEIMSQIYENFLLNFYRLNADYTVKGSKIYQWYLTSDDITVNLIPQMKTDIELTKENTKIIIDAKYYKDAFNSRYDCQKHNSQNMYQMNTYLDHNIGSYNNLRGVLLYPSNGYSFNERYNAEHFSIEFATVDLSKEWFEIESELMKTIA